MPDGGQLAAAFLIGRKAVQDGAENQGGELVADAEKSGLFSWLAGLFRRPQTLPPLTPVSSGFSSYEEYLDAVRDTMKGVHDDLQA
jgi:hypothetical protein